MEAIYAELCARHKGGIAELSNISSFNLDEYVGLSEEDPRSYHYYMRENLFSTIGIEANKGRLPKGAAHDPEQAAAEYDVALAASGGVDMQLLGIGENGHIGFNEPLSGLSTRTRVVALAKATLEQNAKMFGGDYNNVPKQAITMGIGTILEARSILLVATGSAKARAVAQSVEGALSASMPGSALQLHAKCIVVLDQGAASELGQREASERP
ncbi:6-phosphogluconolactonase [Neokomagataea thailandica NBRC 106555]|nr:6-phosphogluconolactonase [Neokomagataea thailandica NBRC 106555]